MGLTLFFHTGFMLLILLTAKVTQFSILIQKRVFSICQTLNMLVTPSDSYSYVDRYLPSFQYGKTWLKKWVYVLL